MHGSDQIEMTSFFRGGTFRVNFYRIGRRESRRHATVRRYGFLLTLSLSLLPLFAQYEAAHGSTIKITPTVSIEESYTDNVRSVAEGAESDLITQTQAGAKFTADGNRLNLNLNVSAVHDYYLDTDGLNGVRPNALGSGEIELFEDHFFVDGSVSVSETSTQRGGARSARDRSLPSNRTQLILYDVSPRLVGNIAGLLEATLLYSHSESLFGKPSSGVTSALPLSPTVGAGPLRNTPTRDQKTDAFSLTFDTGKNFSRINSQLILDKETTKSSGRPKETQDRVDLVNEYQLTRQVALIARAGYEDIGSGDSRLATQGATGALGVHLKPGPRVDFRTEYGRRFGQPNLSANLIYKISSFYTLNARYKQSIETQNSVRRDRLKRQIVGPNGQLIDPLSGFINDPARSNFDLNNAAFRQDALELGLTGTFGRNTINLGADLTSRESGQIAGKEEELDINLNLSRRLQPRLTGNLGAQFSDTLDDGRGPVTAPLFPPVVPAGGGFRNSNEETSYQGDASLIYQLGPSLSSNLEYAYLRRKLGAGRIIAENTLLLGIQAQF